MDFIDNFLNKITMYRLLLYYLIALLVIAAILSLFGRTPYSFIAIAASSLFLTAVCWITNLIFAKTFETHANVESVYITALILALIIAPGKSVNDYIFLFWAGVLAMASKYILAAYKKHLFNPAAIAVVITAFALNRSALWWVGTAVMLPYVLIGGALIVRKIQRWDLVFYFLFSAFLTCITWAFFANSSVTVVAKQALLDTPLFFFAFVMLTEPLTTPPTKNLQIIYGIVVGFLFAPQVHFGSFYLTPELALVVGNVFSYIVSPKTKLMLTLKEKVRLGPDLYNFVFTADRKLKFLPGQYLEWTLGHKTPDNRGNRRYFTIASSPTETELVMGVKFYDPSSSFKKTLFNLKPGSKILAGQLAGDFTMPKDQNQKLAFIAGGIGVTPFRSMVKYLVDKNERRDVAIFYAGRTPGDLVYEDVFSEAGNKLGIPTYATVSQSTPEWNGYTGYINEQMIKENLPDYKQRTFYISGPKSMTDSFQAVLNKMGVSRGQIKTDFFPGFA